MGSRGQTVVEFALLAPVLLLLLLGAIDFGRLLQARVTAESSARAGASWGAAHLQNATALLDPVYALTTKDCIYGPTCNIEYRACREAAGFPGYSGGAILTGGGQSPVDYLACTSGSKLNVCQPSATQSNPFLSVIWRDNNGNIVNPDGTTTQAKVGYSIEVDGTFCFQTIFPTPTIMHEVTWTSRSVFVITP